MNAVAVSAIDDHDLVTSDLEPTPTLVVREEDLDYGSVLPQTRIGIPRPSVPSGTRIRWQAAGAGHRLRRALDKDVGEAVHDAVNAGVRAFKRWIPREARPAVRAQIRQAIVVGAFGVLCSAWTAAALLVILGAR